jgi:hypothetical protein
MNQTKIIEMRPKAFSVMKRVVWLAAITLTTGCAGYQQALSNPESMKGKPVDAVISALQSRGYVCSEKKELNVKAWNENVGLVQCGSKEISPVCPNSYAIRLTFNLQSNLVYTATKTERVNCF